MTGITSHKLLQSFYTAILFQVWKLYSSDFRWLDITFQVLMTEIMDRCTVVLIGLEPRFSAGSTKEHCFC